MVHKAHFATVLLALKELFRVASIVDKRFAARLKELNMIAEIRTTDRRTARHFVFLDGKIRSRRGCHARPDVILSFTSAELGARLMTPPIKWAQQIEAQKNFQILLDGDERKAVWFARTIVMATRIGFRAGTKNQDGSTRYTSMTNGGPVFAYVKDGKILRITPIVFSENDGRSFTIKARGRSFKPPRKAAVSPHALSFKSNIYSPDRNLYPMKRVDFDPNGKRNPEMRGISGYERISWDEAFDLVAGEIKRVKAIYGPSAITFNHPSHHLWGNIGYFTSALYRFANLIGHTRVLHNPDSWEGWYWGAAHHWGNSMRMGTGEGYGTVQDLLDHAELVVFWSSDPEATSGIYGGAEGSVRRLWLKQLGIPTVHIDPYYNHTAAYLGGKWIAPRPGTDTAMALAIAYVWINEGLYNKEFVEQRTHGFEKWRSYILGDDDGVPKSPEWQERETGVVASTVRALAREWGRKRTYLSVGGLGNGFGGACRSPTGIQWARSMVCLNALQGYGRPGVNFGNLQMGTPVDLSMYFPGYGEGGISGDLTFTASAISLYQRMPHLPTMNTVAQQIPRLNLPEAIIDGTAESYPRDGRSISTQFLKVRYPAPGCSPVHLYYRYGSSNMGTMAQSSRWAKMYQSPSLEFVVNQSIYNEAEARFADVILPACTNFERWDISEWCGVGGFVHHAQIQLNHRVIVLQHKCIEPLGESKSDFEIFTDLSSRLGLGAYYSEGVDELEWCKRMFEASDLPRYISWKEFLKKGYFVVPAPEPTPAHPVGFRWFNEGRKKDIPEPYPIPPEYRGDFGHGLPTPTGKFEFDCESLKTSGAEDPERPPVLKYAPSREGHTSPEVSRFPLQLITPHPRFSFHTHGDRKDSVICNIEDHRVLIDGHHYWVLRLNPRDARKRGINHHDLVEVFNDRGRVICAAALTERMCEGVVHGYESSANYDPVAVPGESADRGGALNVLTSAKSQTRQTHAMAASAALVEVTPISKSSRRMAARAYEVAK